MEVVEYLVIGGSWDGEVKEGDLSKDTIRFIHRPQIIVVGPGGIQKTNYVAGGFETYNVIKHKADDGKCYLFAVSPEAEGVNLDDRLRVAWPKPKTIK
ncbi:hypothetical protein [Yersinia aleksiciae]|uniref:hypothetical protein n=1 Tax=Yersinia aleksiciae TaxID=263819 RepID=UPI001427CA5D|nr:hypothetical protein [Yersinia aleksiciae]MDA5496897.1 hypothetical protein [Yersinia aleksiciae]NIK98721.1 hypothetical protein [Yersinia aleksiciae]WQC72364.1 hypothetical protein N0K21_08125 [Yersinia aleksiciae]